jgi:hypothetical protein
MFKWLRRISDTTATRPTERTITPPPSRARLAGGTGRFGLEVVGESFYLPALQQVRRRARRTSAGPVVDVVLRPEPDNLEDVNAVRVMSVDGNALLGYLSRERAREYARVRAQCEEASLVVTCAAVMRGGVEDKPNIGIWLDLAFPARLKSLLKDRLNGDQA